MRTSEQFRNMIKASGVIQIPGCYDCITATIVERAGFPAAYLTGSGISLTLDQLSRTSASGTKHTQCDPNPYAGRY